MQTRKRIYNEMIEGVMNFDFSYEAFFDLLERDKIKSLLDNDQCRIIADKYILASIVICFSKAHFTQIEYTEKNFYLALYLIHELQEDVDDYKDNIVASYLGPFRQTKRTHEKFLRDRFTLFQRMNFDGNVTQQICDYLMTQSPTHWAWKRTRNVEHSGVFYKHIDCQKC